MTEESYNQTCLKVRLFGDEDKLSDEFITSFSDKVADLLVEEGFDNEEVFESIVIVSSNDNVPSDIDEEELAKFILHSDEPAVILIPGNSLDE